MPNEKADMAPAVIFETGPLLLADASAQKDDAMKVADYWMSAPAQQAGSTPRTSRRQQGREGEVRR